MPFNYEALAHLRLETHAEYSKRDTILYALGVGAGLEAIRSGELSLVYEDRLQALPTQAVVLANPGFWLRDPLYNVSWQKVLHGEQSVELHRPLPVAGHVRSLLTVDAIYDKGADKGAVIYCRRELYESSSDEVLATVRHSVFLRGDGGAGGLTTPSPRPHAMPDRDCDHSLTMETRPEQALIYRLSGDPNPLHVDPAVARQAGFQAPILHGLATYGVAGRAVLQTLCENDASRLRRFDARFSSPVYPGENLTVDIWRDGDTKASFRVRVAERQTTVIDNGFAETAA